MEHPVWVALLYFLFVYPLVVAFYFLFRRFKW